VEQSGVPHHIACSENRHPAIPASVVAANSGTFAVHSGSLRNLAKDLEG
jgi:hypothetical protein